jgi:antigen flippase
MEPSVSSTPPAGTPRVSTYGQILKSSVLIGGSSAFNIAIGIVRTKAMALLLGPAGFGLMGLYTSIVNLAQCIAGMGVNSSGVRQIAVAAGSGDPESVKRTATVLRRASLVLGLSGAVLLVLLSRPVSLLTFGTYDRALPVAILSLAVLFKSVSDGQGALVQGLRRIPDLARISILGGLSGTVAGVALVYVFRERGVAPSLIAIAGASLFFSWWFSRRLGLGTPSLSAVQFAQEARGLLRLGFAFMASGMLTMGTAYAVRIMIVRGVGFEAAGLYQSAWTLGGLYVGFILQAMGADFYPRLTAVIRDRKECNRLVNEQAEVSLLLAGPGIIGTLAFAPLVVSVLYSSAFGPAVEVLRWICLGATLQVITWPMGFIIVAEGRQGIFFWSEVAYTAIHLGVAWALVGYLGVNGAGVAFFLSYVCHGLLVYPIVRWLTGFRWSTANRRLGLVFLVFIGLVFCSFYVLPFWPATAVGGLSTVASAAYCLRALVRLVSPRSIPAPLHRLLALLRLVPPDRF